MAEDGDEGGGEERGGRGGGCGGLSGCSGCSGGLGGREGFEEDGVVVGGLGAGFEEEDGDWRGHFDSMNRNQGNIGFACWKVLPIYD